MVVGFEVNQVWTVKKALAVHRSDGQLLMLTGRSDISVFVKGRVIWRKSLASVGATGHAVSEQLNNELRLLGEK
jgi:hypothetical protein